MSVKFFINSQFYGDNYQPLRLINKENHFWWDGEKEKSSVDRWKYRKKKKKVISNANIIIFEVNKWIVSKRQTNLDSAADAYSVIVSNLPKLQVQVARPLHLKKLPFEFSFWKIETSGMVGEVSHYCNNVLQLVDKRGEIVSM